MLQASLMLMYPHAPAYLSRGIGPQRVGQRGYTGSPTADTYRCTDGWLATAPNTPAHFRQLTALPAPPRQPPGAVSPTQRRAGPAGAVQQRPSHRDLEAFHAPGGGFVVACDPAASARM